jgi:long-chain acyl-CoA synthetase
MTAALNRIDTLIAHNARTLPNDVHLILPDGVQQTWSDTYARTQRVAGALARAGVGKGDRVILLTGNSRELAEIYIACSLAGAICVPVNLLSTGHEFLKTSRDCTPAAVVVQHALLDRVLPEFLEQPLRLKIVTQGSMPGWVDYDDLACSGAPLSEPVSDDPNDPGVMIYSSGTTGKPKGILLSQFALIENARMTLSVLRYRQSDVFLTLLPLFSSFGFSWDFLQAALAGAKTVILPKFDPAVAARLIEKHRVTCLAGVPTMYARIFDRTNLAGIDLSSLRLIDVGGGPVSDRLKQELKEGFGIDVVESYGLSEISPVASVQIPRIEHRPGSCGPALPGVEVRVIDIGGKDVPPGTIGELIFRCNTLMVGYWGQPELTENTLRGGWLHSGDVGLVDESGEIQIRDRIKDMIVSSGNNVYPKEVENAISEHPAVQSVAVIGVPDEIRGENIHAFLVRRSSHQLTENEVIEHCTRLIARYKVPRAVIFLDELPLTASGKIKRFELREIARKQVLKH